MDALPPHLLVLFAVVAIQLGAGVSTHLFPLIGVEGAVAVRIIFSALILWFFAKAGFTKLLKSFWQHWKLLVPFGICVTLMNFCFFKAIDRIPLGVVVALEFIGPLSVSAFMSRKFIHLAWVGLAACGIFLLTPLAGARLDGIGVGFALLAGAGWAFFVILSRRVAEHLGGNDGLVIGMTVAALLMIPFAIPVTMEVLTSPFVLLVGFLVGLLSTALPFTLEFAALKRLSATTYGVLVSTEPAVAALVGTMVLGEQIGLRGLVAVGCVVTAAIGVTLTGEDET